MFSIGNFVVSSTEIAYDLKVFTEYSLEYHLPELLFSPYLWHLAVNLWFCHFVDFMFIYTFDLFKFIQVLKYTSICMIYMHMLAFQKYFIIHLFYRHSMCDVFFFFSFSSLDHTQDCVLQLN